MSATGFEDRFSACAAEYRAFRPQYPAALFDWLTACAPSRRRAWDCASGNGQAAMALAARFVSVVGTDASPRQLARAYRHERIRYCVCLAERTALASASVDLVTVAQAFHWFRWQPFYAEVRRVLRPEGVLAVWAYGLLSVTPAVDRVLGRLYSDILGPYWPAQRRLIDAGYAGVALPFTALRPPTLRMCAEWTLAALVGYLRTWSAVQCYRAATGDDPIAAIADELVQAWGGDAPRRAVSWPFYVLAGRRP